MIEARRQRVTLAASQFAVSGRVSSNVAIIRRHIERAARDGADVILFPESALTGYPGVDFESFEGFDWVELRDALSTIRALAAHHGIWVLLGSAQQTETEAFPTNCVHIIGPDGEERTRYDKSMLYRRETEHYTAGRGPIVFRIGSITCGVLICFDSCFPELYAHYESEGVKLLFHAFYNARNEGPRPMDRLMPAQVLTRSYDHSFAILAANSSARHSAMPACFARPDGQFETLHRNAAGLLLTTIEADDHFWEFRRDRSASIVGARVAQRLEVDADEDRTRSARARG